MFKVFKHLDFLEANTFLTEMDHTRDWSEALPGKWAQRNPRMKWRVAQMPFHGHLIHTKENETTSTSFLLLK